jgi:2-oxo-4-hydroxy-4-carboxy-5-ureidoimidazoline decarboxylase
MSFCPAGAGVLPRAAATVMRTWSVPCWCSWRRVSCKILGSINEGGGDFRVWTRKRKGGHHSGQRSSFVVYGNMTISEVNAMGKEGFVEKFGSVYEHSAWVAESVVGERPFVDFEQLICRMGDVVDGADGDMKLELLIAHPDLAGKLGMDELTEDSRNEQRGAGLDGLDQEEFELFTGLNEAYRGRFGFPFIICVGKTDKSGILRAFRERLLNSRDVEVAAALGEVHEIARLRVEGISS